MPTQESHPPRANVANPIEDDNARAWVRPLHRATPHSARCDELKQGSSAANWAPSTEGKSVPAVTLHRSSGVADEPEKFGNPRPKEPRRLQTAMTRAPF